MHVWTRWFSTVCHSIYPLNSCCRAELACYYPKYPWTRKRCSEVVEVDDQQCWILLFNKPVSRPRWQSWYFRNCRGLHKRKTKPLLDKLASSLHRSVSFYRFACGAWPSTGRGVVRALLICSVKIKTVKISSEESGDNFVKFCTSENFPLYSSISSTMG